jgi:formamidopyrimidine-DNA glycosylase
MPELPEVETFKKYFDSTSLNKEVRDVKVRDNRVLNVSEDFFIKEVKSKTFISTKRHGKYLFVDLNTNFLVLHFGMTGDLEYFEKIKEEPPYSKILFKFTNNHNLSYISRRMFGKLDITNTIEEFIKKKKIGA